MATISQVKIANMALSYIGAKTTIESLDESTAEARQCRLWFDYSRIKALEAFDWGFARRRKALAADGQDPPDEWGYRYQYPATCVKFRRIWNPLGKTADAVPFELETNDSDVVTILTNLQEAIGVFTFDATNTAVYTSLFVDALAYQIGQRVAYKLTGKRAIAVDMKAAFKQAVSEAMASSANERVDEPERDPEWIRGR